MARKLQPGPHAVAYSYIRFSSRKQEAGDSLRRQTDLRDAWLARNGVTLDTTVSLLDSGVSAFTGDHHDPDNADQYKLAAFLEMVKRGRIAPGAYLIVEALDRITREESVPALHLFTGILMAGVRIVQLVPSEHVYDDRSQPHELMWAIVELGRGSSESQVKSTRVSEAWSKKKRRAAETGEVVSKQVPRWLRVEDGKIVPDPDKVATVRRIFRMATEGHGLTAITHVLNAEGVPVVGDCGFWARSYVKKILGNRAVVGEYHPHTERRRKRPAGMPPAKGKGGRPPGRRERTADGEPVPNYYPAIITEDEWLAMRAALTSRRGKGGRPPREGVNVFGGLLRDAKHGGNVSVHSYTVSTTCADRRMFGYRAKQGVGGARAVTFPFEVFEKAILSRLREVDPRDVFPRPGQGADEVMVLSGKLAEVEGRLARLSENLVDGDGKVGAILDAVRRLEGERKEVAEALQRARQGAAHPLSESLGEFRSLAETIDSAPDPDEARVRLRGLLRRLVTDILCLFVKQGLRRFAAVQVVFEGGRRRDYLIIYDQARTRGEKRTPADWAVKDRAFPGGELDLRNPKHVAMLEKFLTAWKPDGGGKPG